MSYRIGAAVVLALCFLLSSAGDTRALDVTLPTQISSPTAFVNAETVYLAAENGSITELWTQGLFPGREVYASRSADGGAEWSEPARISTPNMDASFINGYVVQDTFYTAWSQYDPQTAHTGVMFTKSVDSGLNWTEPVELSETGNDIAVVGAAIVFAVYDDGGIGTGNIIVRKSTNFGGTFGPEVTIPSDVYDTAAAVHNNDLFIGYIGPTEAGAWRFPGGDLTQGVQTTFDIQAAGQRIDVGPDGPTLTFTGLNASGVYHTTFDGSDWRELLELWSPPKPAFGFSIPDVAFSSNRTIFAWTEIAQDVPPSVIVASYLRATGVVDNVRFTDPSENYFNPSVLVDGGRAYVAIASSPEGGGAGSEAIEIWGVPAEDPFPPDIASFPYAGTTAGGVPDLNLCPAEVQRSGGIFDDFIDVCMTYVEFANNFAEAELFFGRGSIQGDVDCDSNSSVTAADALAVLREVAGLQAPPCSHKKDVNCDHGIGALDALMIQRAVAALANAVREGCSAIGW